jgi:ATP-dependent helicase/nuclease subunit A
LEQRLAWTYTFADATRQPAKTSVSVLRRRVAELGDEETDARPLTWPATKREAPPPRKPSSARSSRASGLSATEIGTAHHTFLRLVSLPRCGSEADLRAEAERLRSQGALEAEEISALDLAGLAAFWQSELGQWVRSQAAHVQREIPFTVRLPAAQVAAISAETAGSQLNDEFVVVQGAVDLAVLLPGEIRIVDFKTDRVAPGQLPEKVKDYSPQLQLYAQALALIYRRPVSASWLYFLNLRQAVPVG